MRQRTAVSLRLAANSTTPLLLYILCSLLLSSKLHHFCWRLFIIPATVMIPELSKTASFGFHHDYRRQQGTAERSFTQATHLIQRANQVVVFGGVGSDLTYVELGFGLFEPHLGLRNPEA